MDEPDAYAPQSPDFSAYNTASPPPHAPPAQPNNHAPFRDTFTSHPAYHASPYFSPQPQQPPGPAPPHHNTSNNHNHTGGSNNYSSKTHSRPKDDDDDYMPDASSPRTGRSSRAKKMDVKSEGEGEASATSSVLVKTKFPVARIKRIMQADEDVGKVAQVTPVIVCKRVLAPCPDNHLLTSLAMQQRRHWSSS
jgi:Dr1-associated corepressor